MIFVTGDTHGELERFSDKGFKQLKIGDTLIILGDFGFVWKNDKAQQKTLKKLAKLPFKILFIDGLNENFDALDTFPMVTYMNAKAREIFSKKIYYICRGEVLHLEDKKILCFGGNDNLDPDIIYDTRLPSEEEFKTCLCNLEKENYQVDYILTHIPSGKINRFLNLESFTTSELMSFLDVVTEKTVYEKWYFGSYHQDKYVSPKMQGVYQDIIKIGQ